MQNTHISKRFLALLLLLVVTPLLAFSCHDLLGGNAGGPNTPPDQLGPLSGSWILQAFRDFDALMLPLLGTEITLTINSDRTFTGSAGCNSYFGSFSIAGNLLDIHEIGITEMACLQPDGVMQQEQDFIDQLLKTDSFQLDGDFLNLNHDLGDRGLFFQRHLPDPPALQNTSWVLEAFRELDMMILPLPNTELTLVFSQDRGVSGSSGCNSFFGNYDVLPGGHLEITQLASTKIACATDINEQEMRFLEGLQNAERFRIENETLTIHYNNGENDLIYKAQTR